MANRMKPLAMQTGNLTQEQQNRKRLEESLVMTGRDDLARAPDWLLDDTAAVEFTRLVREFEKIDVVGNLDLNNLGAYCNAYTMYRKATDQLRHEPLIVSKKLPNGATQQVENPLIKIQKTYAEEMRKFASLCGLTLDSRLKAGKSQNDKREKDLADEFGDI